MNPSGGSGLPEINIFSRRWVIGGVRRATF
jgi:hypothetical protein